MNGEAVGEWTFAHGSQQAFRYLDAWLASPMARPISISMPLRPSSVPYVGPQVEAFFDNLLPDSQAIRRRIQARFGIASDAAFDLLAEIGRDCVGAIQLLPEGETPPGINTIQADRLSEADVARLLRGVAGADARWRDTADDFRISIAGAQEKTALLAHDGAWHLPRGATPTTHILKLPLGRVGNMQADFATSVENEWLCANIVRAFGLAVAACEIATFEDQKALVVTRFDRRLAAGGTHWLRLPQEDLCQATGTPPALKYEADGGPGIARAMDLLLGSSQAAADRETFFRTQLVFWLLCATDGHAKNFSVHIGPAGRYRLTPLYDILSAHPILGHGARQLPPERATLAMAAISNNRHYHWARILPRHWDSTARHCGLDEAHAIRLRHELAAETPAVIERVAADLPSGFPPAVADAIFSGLAAAAARLGV
jgi:serine/threonine-protein kinase HipA